MRAAAFAPAPRPASLPLRSAKPPHSGRPRFQLVPQPENPSVALSRPFVPVPAVMLGLAPLALRVWAYANGRTGSAAASLLVHVFWFASKLAATATPDGRRQKQPGKTHFARHIGLNCPVSGAEFT